MIDNLFSETVHLNRKIAKLAPKASSLVLTQLPWEDRYRYLKFAMYKICLSALLLILSSSRIAAEEPVSSFVIYLMDGTSMTCQLSDKPTIKFTLSDLVVNSEKSSFTIPLDNLAKFGFESSTSGVEVVKPDKPNYTIYGNRILVKDLASGTCVRLYNVNGIRVFERTCNMDNGTMEIDVDSLPSGVYLLNINSNTAKIAIR